MPVSTVGRVIATKFTSRYSFVIVLALARGLVIFHLCRF